MKTISGLRAKKIKEAATTALVTAAIILVFIAVSAFETWVIGLPEDEGYKDTAVHETAAGNEAVSVRSEPDYWYVQAIAEPEAKQAVDSAVESAEEAGEPEETVPDLLRYESIGEYTLTDEEMQLISVVAWNADYTDDESLMCVIQTIKNRLDSPKFKPDTVEGILRQKGQFEPCDTVLYNKQGYDFDRIAELIERVWAEGYDPFSGEDVLFYSAGRIDKKSIANNLRLAKTAGGTNFYAQD